MSKSPAGLALLAAALINASSSEVRAQSNSFGQTTIDGIEVAVGGKTRLREPSFLSNDSLCGQYYENRLDLEGLGKQIIAALNSAGFLPDGVAFVRQEVNLSSECRASVVVGPGQLNVVWDLPRNLVRTHLTTPTPLGQDADPELTVDFDMRASAQIALPTTAASGLTMNGVKFRAFNIHPDSQNFTGDIVLAAVDVISAIIDRNLMAEFSSARSLELGTVRANLPNLCGLIGTGCEEFRLTANYAPNNLLRLDLDGPTMAEIVTNNPALLTSLGTQADVAAAVPVPVGIVDQVTEAVQCKIGFVWRTARPEDLVCVPPESRNRTAVENTSPEARWVADGAYGPHTCIAGLVWREAFEGDTICVSPEVKATVRTENQLAANNRAGG